MIQTQLGWEQIDPTIESAAVGDNVNEQFISGEGFPRSIG